MADETAGGPTATTVSGPVPGASLGVALVHEHLVGAFAPPRDEGLAIAELDRFRSLGGATVVDLGTPDTGRDPLALRRIAEATGVHVVMAGGWEGAAWLDPAVGVPDARRLAEELAAELADGVDGTGIRPGVVRAPARPDPSDARDRALLVAAAGAARAAGAPILVGAGATLAATVETLAILEAEAVDPARIAVGGVRAFALDPLALAALLDRGVRLAFDGFGRIPTALTEVDDHDAATAIARLADGGLLDRVLVSQGIANKVDLVAFGGGGYGFLLERFVPYFLGLGAGRDDVDALLVDNPRRFLTGEGTA